MKLTSRSNRHTHALASGLDGFWVQIARCDEPFYYACVRQALAAVPQLADGLAPLGRKSAENLHSVVDMCVANLPQLDDASAGPGVVAGLAGTP